MRSLIIADDNGMTERLSSAGVVHPFIHAVPRKSLKHSFHSDSIKGFFADELGWE